MPESAKFLIVLCSFAAILSFIKMIKSGHFIKCFTVSSFTGIGSLFAVNLISFVTGMTLSINFFSIVFCALTGMGGSIFLLLLNTLRYIG